MEAVIILVLLIILGVIAVPLLLFNKIASKVDRLEEKIELLYRQKASEDKSKTEQTFHAQEQAETPEPKDSEVERPTEPDTEPSFPEEEAPVSEQSAPSVEETFESAYQEKTPEVEPVHSEEPSQTAEGPESKQSSFLQHIPDLEKYIGENVINKIGIAILVLGIGFFVQLAISRNWIGEIGQVMIGVLCGGILLFLGHRLRERFTAFSSVLVGGGIAVLYFSITIGFQQYHIFGQTLAFAIMILITGFAVLLSLAYDRVELAVLALLGGFASPFLVSTGEGSYITLYTYLLILNAGMLTLAYFKHWHLVNILAYLGTIILFGSWLVNNFFAMENPPYAVVLLFATLFYFTFFAMSIIYNLKVQKSFEPIEFSILLSNTFLYYSVGMVILDDLYGSQLQGLFTGLIAVFNFIFAFYFHQKQSIDRNFRYLLIGLVITFLSLIGPVQLQGNHITLFWSLEAVLLLWLSQKTGIGLMKVGSVIVSALMFFSLLMDWSTIYINGDAGQLLPIINKGFVTGIFGIGSLLGSFLLFMEENKLRVESGQLDLAPIVHGFAGFLTLIAFLTGFLELHHQMDAFQVHSSIQTLLSGLYIFLFLTGFYLLLASKAKQKFVQLTYPLLLSGVVVYPLYYNNAIVALRNEIFQGVMPFTPFLVHLLVLVFPFLFLYFLYHNLKKQFENHDSNTLNLFSWFGAAMIVILLSQELNHWIVLAMKGSGYSIGTILENTVRIGYPILWGLCSFVFMWVGMRLKFRQLRLISLSLFFLTLAKLFVHDIQDVSKGGKIAAFISLGILLLIVSFMYQRLKRLVLDTNHQNQDEEEKISEYRSKRDD